MSNAAETASGGSGSAPRRTLTVLLSAGACAAVLAAPFAIRGLAPSGTPPGTGEDRHGSGPEPRGEGDAMRVDLDGDGRADLVQIRWNPHDNPVTAHTWVTVETVGGQRSTVHLPVGYVPSFLPATALDSTPGREVLLSQQGVHRDHVTVLTWRQSRLVRATLPGRPLLGNGFDGQGRTLQYWFRGGRLYSLRGVDAGAGGRWSRARTWSWSLQGAAMVATSEGVRCVDAEHAVRPSSTC